MSYGHSNDKIGLFFSMKGSIQQKGVNLSSQFLSHNNSICIQYKPEISAQNDVGI